MAVRRLLVLVENNTQDCAGLELPHHNSPSRSTLFLFLEPVVVFASLLGHTRRPLRRRYFSHVTISRLSF